MKTSRYRAGVLDIVSRARKYNPEIGNYLHHTASEDEFLVRLSNGALRISQDAAHRQEVYPANVPEEWIIEIGNSFQRSEKAGITDTPPKWKKVLTLFRKPIL